MTLQNLATGDLTPQEVPALARVVVWTLDTPAIEARDAGAFEPTFARPTPTHQWIFLPEVSLSPALIGLAPPARV